MKKIIALAVLSLALSGCSYSYDQVEESKKACSKLGGEFVPGNPGADGVIYKTFCRIDEFKYLYIRGTGKFEMGEAR